MNAHNRHSGGRQRRRPRKKRSSQATFQLEPVYTKVRELLFEDLQDRFSQRLAPHCREDRDLGRFALNRNTPPLSFKKFVQLRDFDKRVIWSTDKANKLLQLESLVNFEDSQESFGVPEGPRTEIQCSFISVTQNILKNILGDFNLGEVLKHVRPGKRAAYGLSRQRAYLDQRIKKLSYSGDQKAVFQQLLVEDIHLFRCMRKFKKRYKQTSWVKVTSVPKSFKSARIIAPDTVIGSFLSNGVGDVIRERLERGTHIRLASQPERHKHWARKGSIDASVATLDMSKASDSFTWQHILRYVPEDWHEILRVVRTGVCESRGIPVPLKSFMLMGSGHTFPLQTLLFYALCESVRIVTKTRGFVSVFGDDLIVPIRIAEQVVEFLQSEGFVINTEKSFYDKRDTELSQQFFFRESCGGDFVSGVDVRPYMPETDFQSLGPLVRNSFLAELYKLCNGLQERWDSYMIPNTLTYLHIVISQTYGKVHIVPQFEGDFSGCRDPEFRVPGIQYEEPRINPETWLLSYFRLTMSRRKRRRGRFERSYYWYWLRNSFKKIPVDHWEDIDSLPILPEVDRRDKGSYTFAHSEPKPK